MSCLAASERTTTTTHICASHRTLFGFLFVQEHVEEDRFIRDLDAKYFAKQRAKLEEARAHDDLQHFQNIVAPTMYQVQLLLSETGDSVSDAALEALARWKIGA